MKLQIHSKIPKNKTAGLIALVISLLIISQTGCSTNKMASSQPDPVSGEGFYLDTICQITIYAMENPVDMTNGVAENVIDKAFDICREYENLLSKTVETSDISKINNAKGEPVNCDDRTVDLIRESLDFGRLSDGSFNITVGGLVELWDFHAIEPKVPDKEAIQDAVSHVYDITLDEENQTASDDVFVMGPPIIIEGNTIRLSDPETKIDLGGIAKGYIADRVTEYLQKQGVSGAVVDLGGNIVVIGYKDGEKAEQEMTVGIRKPYTETGELADTLTLHDACVVTSGTYERYIEEGGVKYHHVLDPKTGYPSDSGLTSVTVVGPIGSSHECDALATIILIKGEAWANDNLESIGEYSLILIRDDGSIKTMY